MSDHEKPIHVTAVVGTDGSIRVDGLPLQVGQAADVMIHALSASASTPSSSRHPLAGLPVEYAEPFQGIAEEDWGASR